MEYHVIKIIGKGMFGTAYLIRTKDNQLLVLKRGRIPSKQIKQFIDGSSGEMKFYKWIDTLSPNIQRFFNPLISMQVLKGEECRDPLDPTKLFVHRRENKQKLGTKFQKIIDSFRDSKFCIDIISEYGGKELGKWLARHSISKHNVLFIILQIIIMFKTMEKGKLFHNDLHTGNLCIRPTIHQESIRIGSQTITGDYIITAIDYGEAIMNFKKLAKSKDAYQRAFSQYTDEMRDASFLSLIFMILCQHSKFIDRAHKLKKKLPWEKNKENMFWGNLLRGDPEYWKWIRSQIDSYNIRKDSNLTTVLDKIESSKLHICKTPLDFKVWWLPMLIEVQYQVMHPRKFSEYEEHPAVVYVIYPELCQGVLDIAFDTMCKGKRIIPKIEKFILKRL